MRNILLSITALLITTQIAMADVWQVRKIKNDFNGANFVRIHTEYLKLNQPLGFPYQDLKVAAAVDCVGDSQTFSLVFSMDPNLTNYTLKTIGNEIYKQVAVQVKLDGGDIKNYTAMNKIGSSWLVFGGYLTPEILDTKKLMLQMDFYQGTRHVTIDMSKRKKCSEHITKR